ncbi:hypothetical protein CYMTET_2538 [Cymbomonas tetramitiformis]|uniref:HTH merR-type domain-containing protein n=1 Tax=Cymbomonas tetramitiformis TaxID=36881 RepID=A0AAE0H5G6_9CHLO|nr:hypothetical protein CYMTET_2538 [Cymbomonas tetramitiformis]
MTSSFVKAKVAAERLGVSVRVLRNWDAKGVIATVRTPGGSRLFDVDGYLAKQATEQQKKRCAALLGGSPETIRNATDGVTNDNNPTTLPVAATSSLDAWKMDVEAVFKSVHEKSKNNASAFPIRFDKAAEWIGFSTKSNAKRHLVENFEEATDFVISSEKMKKKISEVDFRATEKSRGRDAECIYLTGDCFKALCMTARTEQGKRVRKYYLELEKRLRDGDLTLAGEVVQNYDAKNNVRTDVLLKTTEDGANGAPTWVGVWRDARTKQMMAGKSMVDMLKDKGVTDLRAYQVVENLHNQSVLGFKGWTKNWLKKNRIKVTVGAEAMSDSQVNLRKIFTERFCKLLTPIEAPNSDDVRRIAQEVHDYVERFATEMEMNTYMPTTDDRGRKVPWGKRVREIEGRQRRVLRKRLPHTP